MPAAAEGYKPSEDFEEDVNDPLIDISLSDSKELWLIQWPLNQLQPPDFDGKEVSLKLHEDGTLGSFIGSSGKEYELVSFKSQVPEASVIVSSSSESKIVGKISRRVSLVHYPDPEKLRQEESNDRKSFYLRSEGSSMASSSRSPAMSRGTYLRSPHSGSGRSSSSKRSSRVTSTSSKHTSSDGISSGSLENSHRRKSKKARQEA